MKVKNTISIRDGKRTKAVTIGLYDPVILKNTKSSKKPIMAKGAKIFESLCVDNNSASLIDFLSSKEETDDPEFNLTYHELIDLVRKKLDLITYTPNGFVTKNTTFVRKVFESLYSNNEKFLKFSIFHHHCAVRYATNAGRNRPTSTAPKFETISTFFNVDIRTINMAVHLIKQAVLECANANGGSCEKSIFFRERADEEIGSENGKFGKPVEKTKKNNIKVRRIRNRAAKVNQRRGNAYFPQEN